MACGTKPLNAFVHNHGICFYQLFFATPEVLKFFFHLRTPLKMLYNLNVTLKHFEKGAITMTNITPRDVSNVPDHPKAFDDLPAHTQQRVLKWITANLIPTKSTYRLPSSYRLKTIYAGQTADGNDNYLTNGEFKGAMLKAGFHAEDESALNWRFNIAQRSPAIRRSIGWFK